MNNDQSHSNDDPRGGSTRAAPDRPDPVRVEVPPTGWFDWSDRWTLRAFLVGVPVVTGLIGLIAPILDWSGDKPMLVANTGQLEFPDAQIDTLSSLRYDSVSANIYLDHPGVGDRLVGLMLPLIGVALLAFGAVILLRITRDISGGYPFSATNVRRMRLLSVAIFAAGAFYALVPPMTAWAFVLPDADAADSFRVQAVIDLTPLVLGMIAGLVVLMLGQAFAAGHRLADDVAEVI